MKTTLNFALDVQNDWPPVTSECLPFEIHGANYILLSPPLFVGNLSVGDEVLLTRSELGFVSDWRHVERSGRSVVWLLRLSPADGIGAVLESARALGCNSAGSDTLGSFAIDVPADVPIQAIEDLLDRLDENSAAVAFPSFRHTR